MLNYNQLRSIMVITNSLGRLAAGSAVVAGALVASRDQKSTSAADSYPPTGLSAGVLKLPNWIQAGTVNIVI